MLLKYFTSYYLIYAGQLKHNCVGCVEMTPEKILLLPRLSHLLRVISQELRSTEFFQKPSDNNISVKQHKPVDTIGVACSSQ